jgi:hypothetical protein
MALQIKEKGRKGVALSFDRIWRRRYGEDHGDDLKEGVGMPYVNIKITRKGPPRNRKRR